MQYRQSGTNFGFKHRQHYVSSLHTAASADLPTSPAPDKLHPTTPADCPVPVHPNRYPTMQTLLPAASAHIRLLRYCDAPTPFVPDAGNNDCGALARDFLCAAHV